MQPKLLQLPNIRLCGDIALEYGQRSSPKSSKAHIGHSMLILSAGWAASGSSRGGVQESKPILRASVEDIPRRPNCQRKRYCGSGLEPENENGQQAGGRRLPLAQYTYCALPTTESLHQVAL